MDRGCGAHLELRQSKMCQGPDQLLLQYSDPTATPRAQMAAQLCHSDSAFKFYLKSLLQGQSNERTRNDQNRRESHTTPLFLAPSTSQVFLFNSPNDRSHTQTQPPPHTVQPMNEKHFRVCVSKGCGWKMYMLLNYNIHSPIKKKKQKQKQLRHLTLKIYIYIYLFYINFNFFFHVSLIF